MAMGLGDAEPLRESGDHVVQAIDRCLQQRRPPCGGRAREFRCGVDGFSFELDLLPGKQGCDFRRLCCSNLHLLLEHFGASVIIRVILYARFFAGDGML